MAEGDLGVRLDLLTLGRALKDPGWGQTCDL
jgi:hypothetical protein